MITGQRASPSRRAIASTVSARAGAGGSMRYPPASPVWGFTPSRIRGLDAVSRRLADLGLQALADQQLGADGQVDGTGGRRGGLAQGPRRRHRDGGGIRPNIVGAARLLGDRSHGFRLAEPGKRRETAVVLKLGGPVAGDDEQRGARDLGVEELPRELVRAPPHGGD